MQRPEDFELSDEIIKQIEGQPHITDTLMGEAFLEADRLDRAEEFFRRADKRKSNAPLLAYHLARLTMRRKQPDKALKLIEQYLAVHAEDGSCWVTDRYFSGVYRIAPDGELAPIRADLEQSGEVAIDAEGGRGWIADRERGAVFWFVPGIATDTLALEAVDAVFADPGPLVSHCLYWLSFSIYSLVLVGFVLGLAVLRPGGSAASLWDRAPEAEAQRRRWWLVLLLAFLAYNLLLYLPLHVKSRYRIQMLPIFFMYTGCAGAWLAYRLGLLREQVVSWRSDLGIVTWVGVGAGAALLLLLAWARPLFE